MRLAIIIAKNNRRYSNVINNISYRILSNHNINHLQIRSFSNNDSFRDVLKKAKANTEINNNDNNNNNNNTTINNNATNNNATNNNGDDDKSTKKVDENNNEETVNGNNTNENTINDDEKKSSSAEYESIFMKFTNFTKNIDIKELPRQAFDVSKTLYFSAIDNFKEGWDDMLGKNKKSVLQKKVMQADSFRQPKKKVDENEDDEEVEEEKIDSGPSAIVLVHQPKSAWEQMKNRLQDSPFIKEMLKNSQKIGKVAADTPIGQQAQKISQGFKDKLEDAREIWETSQNPLIYTVSGIWDNVTGDTEESICIKEIRKLDPEFIKEEWAEEVRHSLVPDIIKSHLLGETKKLKKWCGEAVYNKLAADIRARKSDGITFDTNILDIEEHQMVLRHLADRGNISVIVCVYLVQQINCVRNKAGEIIEGGESEVRAKIYSIAFQQNYNEETGEVGWKIVDYEFGGDMAYI